MEVKVFQDWSVMCIIQSYEYKHTILYTRKMRVEIYFNLMTERWLCK
jgi:hypothetical protein